MAYGRSSDGMSDMTNGNISIDFVLLFILNCGWRPEDCRLNKDSPGSRGNIRRRSYIPETSFVSWALLD